MSIPGKPVTCKDKYDNRILYFDELDKACSKNGSNEITNILIHLTDPNMNKSFQDRFFQGVDFPLDKVIMIFSYNDSSLIDRILVDRFIEIDIKPYNINDKVKILKDYMFKEVCISIGFDVNEFQLKDDDIKYIIDKYTYEAGVRELKRKIEFRKKEQAAQSQDCANTQMLLTNSISNKC